MIIAGQGLAGTTLAWALWMRGVDFTLVDPGTGGSSRMAAGMINPVTGKNFEPSWRIGEFLPEALEFYGDVERHLERRFWFSMPVLRLAESEKEWNKIESKLEEPHVAPWVGGVVSPPDGWAGGVNVRGGGRFDAPGFIEASRDFFESRGCYRTGEISGGEVIWCDGAAGLMAGRHGPHRCAKGEILTLRAGWDDTRITVGAGGWLVPVGNGVFKAGSTYEWGEPDSLPTEKGRARIVEIVRKLAGDDFEVSRHAAGIRPILRRSEPLIGPAGDVSWMLNGLGSKGCLYAPGMAQRLVRWMVDGVEPEREVDLRVFLNQESR